MFNRKRWRGAASALLTAAMLAACAETDAEAMSLADALDGTAPQVVEGERTVAFVAVGVPVDADEGRSQRHENVARAIQALSDGRLTLEPSAFSFMVEVAAEDRCDLDRMSDVVEELLVDAGRDAAEFDHVVIEVVAPEDACKGGRAEIGGRFSVTWRLGTPGSRTVEHELLHNFGLRHAGLLRCVGGEPDRPVPFSSACELDYDADGHSVMGKGGARDLPATQRAMLGWLAGDQIRSLDSSGTVELACGAGAALLLVPAGGGLTYAIEPDCNESLPAGVEVRITGAGGGSLLIDATPDTRATSDARFAPGVEPFIAPGGRVAMRVEARSGSRIAVQITLDPGGEPPSIVVHRA